MGPIRRSKSKKKAEQPTTSLVTPPLPQPQLSDWWHDFSKRFHGSLSKSTDSQSFESMFKMSMKTFDYISSLVKEDIIAKTPSFMDLNGIPLCLYDVVATALRRLGSGDSLAIVGTSLNLNQTTVAQITKLFVDTLEFRGICHIRWPESESEMEAVKSKLEKIAGLPNCCGAIDTSHVMMCVSTADRSTQLWCDREKNQTVTFQVIADADLRFRDLVGGWPGCMTDERIHKKSTFFKFCKSGERLNGKRRVVSEGNEIEEYIVGNSGFRLLPWLMTPYRGNKLCDSEVRFNQMVMKTQMVAQKALGKLKQNWKIIQGVMWRPDKDRLPVIILACCILHNILIDMEDEVQEKLVFSHRHDLDYRPAVCHSDDDKKGVALREKITLHLSGGSKP
ncbi:unnamed protein product [Lactuca virosa]|uniref:DDE Tnp4 domain-containing protein n=1 Tax=Lactuca virosa TaxID=75947 RepID=A0AAU9NKX2_9ASTR|nr:unnamed protein product [Lactuca virosa]